MKLYLVCSLCFLLLGCNGQTRNFKDTPNIADLQEFRDFQDEEGIDEEVVPKGIKVDQTVRESSQYRRAMTSYRIAHTNCEYCGSTLKIQIHHIRPLWLDITLASDTNNMIALCGGVNGCHFIIGHCRDFGHKASVNIRELCKRKKIVERKIENLYNVKQRK